jgi:hypothetical protein
VTSLPDDQDRKSLRASDQDRERAAEIVRAAAGDGRLGLDEIDERLNGVYSAKTHADLEPVIQDLGPAAIVAASGSPVMPAGEAAVRRSGGEPPSGAAIAIMSGFTRKGAWVVPENFTAVAIMGGGEIDLREAQFPDRVVTINAFTIMGGIAIIVPEDAVVQVTGIGLMGAFEHGATGAGKTGSPTIIIKGLAFWGAVDVRRKPLDREVRRQKLETKLRKLESRRERE